MHMRGSQVVRGWWRWLAGERRGRHSARVAGAGMGLVGAALTMSALQAQGNTLLGSHGGGMSLGRILELLLVPALVGAGTGLVTWATWRATVAHQGRRLDDHDAALARLRDEKADKDVVREAVDRLREVMDLHLRQVEATAARMSEDIRTLRSETEKRWQKQKGRRT